MKAGEQGTLGQVLSARALLQSQRRSEQAFSMRSHASLIISIDVAVDSRK